MNLSFRTPLLIQQVSLRAILYMILSAFCFAFVELFLAHFLKQITIYQLIWGRYAVHLLFMLAVLGPRYKTKLVKTSNLKLQIIRSLTMLAMPISYIIATQQMQMPSNDASAVYWLSPLMMLGLSTLVLHESVGGIRWIGAIIGLGGMLLIYRPDKGIISLAALPVLITGLSISLHLMFSRILREDHPFTSLFHTALWVFAIMSFLMPFVWQRPSLSDLVTIVVVGLVGMVALYVLARSGELAPLSVVATFSYTEGIWTLLLNVLLFGILPDKSMILGGLVLVGVTAYLLFHETRHPQALPLNAEHHLSS